MDLSKFNLAANSIELGSDSTEVQTGLSSNWCQNPLLFGVITQSFTRLNLWYIWVI